MKYKCNDAHRSARTFVSHTAGDPCRLRIRDAGNPQFRTPPTSPGACDRWQKRFPQCTATRFRREYIKPALRRNRRLMSHFQSSPLPNAHGEKTKEIESPLGFFRIAVASDALIHHPHQEVRYSPPPSSLHDLYRSESNRTASRPTYRVWTDCYFRRVFVIIFASPYVKTVILVIVRCIPCKCYTPSRSIYYYYYCSLFIIS